MDQIQPALAKVLAFAKSKEAKKGLGASLVLMTLYYLRRFMNFLKWRREMLKLFPGTKNPSIMLGDLGDFMAAGGFEEVFFEQLHAKHGEIARFFLGPTMLNVSLGNPEWVIELYKKTKDRPFETYMFLFYLGEENLLFQHGPIVKEMRLRYGKMISNVDQLQKLNDITYKKFGEMVSRWGDYGANGVNVHQQLGPVIYDVMGQVMFGGSWSTSAIGKEIYNCHMYLIHNTNKWMIWPFKPWFLSEYREYAATLQRWRQLCGQLIDERAEEIRRNPAAWENDETALTMLVTSKNADGTPFFSKGRAISTMCGFLNGAYDTTHATMYWLMFNLARYPHVQEKLRNDIRSVIGSKTQASVEEARQVEYMEAFIRESMRLNNTVPVNMRVNYESDITVGGYHIPKGVNVNIPNSVIFRNQKFFGADTESFRPERFLPSDPNYETAKRMWTAFGAHARMCIGFTFALVEMKAVLINILQQYTIQFADPSFDNDERKSEVGVNQPANKAQFVFTPVNASTQISQQNMEWWTPPKEKRKSLTK